MTGRTSYRVLYFVGPSLDLSTKMLPGRAEIDGECFRIVGSSELSIPLKEIREPNLFRLHGTARMIRFAWKEGTVFVTVVRVNIFGYFAVINFFATGRLYESLKSLAATA